MRPGSKQGRVMGESPSSFVSGAVTLIDVAGSIRNSAHPVGPQPDLNDIERRVLQRLRTPELTVNGDDDLLVAAIDWDLEFEELAQPITGLSKPITKEKALSWTKPGIKAKASSAMITLLAAIMFLGALGGSVSHLDEALAQDEPSIGAPPTHQVEVSVPAKAGTVARVHMARSADGSPAISGSAPADAEADPSPPRAEECNVGDGMICITVPLPPLPQPLLP